MMSKKEAFNHYFKEAQDAPECNTFCCCFCGGEFKDQYGTDADVFGGEGTICFKCQSEKGILQHSV